MNPSHAKNSPTTQLPSILILTKYNQYSLLIAVLGLGADLNVP